MQLALGTAQFGLTYGVANSSGQISQQSANEILELCRLEKINTLDTAISYGESEQCLGLVGVNDFSLITKLPSIPRECKNINSWVLEEVRTSLLRLKVSSIYGLMLHQPEDLLGNKGPEILKTLKDLKSKGVVEKIGISVYSPEQLSDIFSIHVFDIVQCPFNIIDRRLSDSGWLKKLSILGVEVHVRSCFLQGLLVMPRNRIPAQFQHWEGLWDIWHEWLEKNNTSSLEACISFVFSHTGINRLVVGVDSKLQLMEIILATQNIDKKKFPNIGSLDDNLINPSKWKPL
tara:strand:+ start:5822 stop:6688 length:867 start_codon:yes stop_codon:yes gene_type:complete